MKIFILSFVFLTSFSAVAADLSVSRFMGSTYVGKKYIVRFLDKLSASGEVQAILEEKRFFRNDEREIPVVRVDGDYIKFYFDEDVDNVQFWGASARLGKKDGKTQICFPLENYQFDCLNEVITY